MQIDCQDIVKRYDGHVALDGVSIEVSGGSIYGLLGPNGAGKTTLIRILNQIIYPDHGTVLIDGTPLLPTDVMRMGYLPEERGLYKKMTALEQIVFFGCLKGMRRGVARAEAMRWMRRMNIDRWADKRIEMLSKGMAQKVQFIATVVHRPRLLIFDEPFSGFDPVNAEMLKQEIRNLNEDGSTIIFSTHNMESVEEICNEFSLIDHARVVLNGKVEEVRHRFRKNVYSVTVCGEVPQSMPGMYEIISVTPHDGSTEICMRLSPDMTLRDIVAYLNDNYDIKGFNEILPTMHEIFIETVNPSVMVKQ